MSRSGGRRGSDYVVPGNLVFLLNETGMSGIFAQSVKNLPAVQKTQVRSLSWRRKWQPTPVSLPGKSHGQRSLVGCSPWGRSSVLPSNRPATPLFSPACWKLGEVAQSCPTLSDPMDCSPLGSSVYGIFQARVLEWGAIAFERQLTHPQL